MSKNMCNRKELWARESSNAILSLKVTGEEWRFHVGGQGSGRYGLQWTDPGHNRWEMTGPYSVVTNDPMSFV